MPGLCLHFPLQARAFSVIFPDPCDHSIATLKILLGNMDLYQKLGVRDLVGLTVRAFTFVLQAQRNAVTTPNPLLQVLRGYSER